MGNRVIYVFELGAYLELVTESQTGGAAAHFNEALSPPDYLSIGSLTQVIERKGCYARTENEFE